MKLNRQLPSLPCLYFNSTFIFFAKNFFKEKVSHFRIVSLTML